MHTRKFLGLQRRPRPEFSISPTFVWVYNNVFVVMGMSELVPFSLHLITLCLFLPSLLILISPWIQNTHMLRSGCDSCIFWSNLAKQMDVCHRVLDITGEVSDLPISSLGPVEITV